jgi:phytoene synthase
MSQPASTPLHAFKPGSSLYYAAQSAPVSARPALLAWGQWWHEVSAIPLTVHDPGVAQTKLAWWQQEVRNSFDGKPQHPLTRQLFDATSASGQRPPQALWQEQLEGLQVLVQQTRWLDELTQRRHALATTGAACEGAAWLLGAQSPAALAAARDLGWGLRQAHHLARLGQDARTGWLHVPVSTLQQHDVKAHELLRPLPGQAPPHWPALLAYLHAQAKSSLLRSSQAMATLPPGERKALRPLRVLAALHLALIDDIAAQGPRVLQERIILTPLRKWWISTRVRWGRLR